LRALFDRRRFQLRHTSIRDLLVLAPFDATTTWLMRGHWPKPRWPAYEKRHPETGWRFTSFRAGSPIEMRSVD
jgi:hypothetical protein